MLENLITRTKSTQALFFIYTSHYVRESSRLGDFKCFDVRFPKYLWPYLVLPDLFHKGDHNMTHINSQKNKVSFNFGLKVASGISMVEENV